MLAETICKAQKGDEKSTLELLTLFNRLMTRYAYLLEYEDAINDLTLDFIALLQIKKFTIFQMQAICLHNYSANVLLLILLHLAGIGKMRPI